MSTAGELAIRAHRGPVHSAVRVLVLVGGLALAGLICELAGVDLSGWLGRLFDKVAEVSPGWVVLGLAIQTVQTFLISLAWLAILRSAYGQHSIGLMPVFAAYAVSVALNCLLPANLGTFVMLTMFLALVQGATLAGLFSAFLVQKLPYAVIGVSLYLYLFISVAGSFSIKLKRIADHPWMATLIVIGGIVLIALLGRIFWPRLESLWQQGEARRHDPLEPARLRPSRRRAGTRRVRLQARRGCGLPRGVRDSRLVPRRHVRRGLELARQFRVRDAGRRRREPDAERGGAARRREREERGGVLDRPPAAHVRVERGRRGRPRRVRLRLVGRAATADRLVHGGPGEGRGASRESAA
jgi:lysylphosphatidylglycerol synthase-like protein